MDILAQDFTKNTKSEQIRPNQAKNRASVTLDNSSSTVGLTENATSLSAQGENFDPLINPMIDRDNRHYQRPCVTVSISGSNPQDSLTTSYQNLSKNFSYIPGSRATKKPCVKWKPFQTTRADRDQLVSWRKQFPACNWLVITGEISGVVVVDCDTEAAYLEAQRRGLPKTFTVKTTRGWHMYYQYDPAVKTKIGFFKNCDIKSDRAYVRAVGSKNDQGVVVYTVIDDSPIVAPPDWIKPKSTHTAHNPKSHDVTSVPINVTRNNYDDRLIALAKGWRDGYLTFIAQAVAGEDTNKQINRAAYQIGHLVGAGVLDEAESYNLLLDAAYRCGYVQRDGLKQTEDTIKSGLYDGIAKPRDLRKYQRETSQSSVTNAQPAEDVTCNTQPAVSWGNTFCDGMRKWTRRATRSQFPAFFEATLEVDIQSGTTRELAERTGFNVKAVESFSRLPVWDIFFDGIGRVSHTSITLQRETKPIGETPPIRSDGTPGPKGQVWNRRDFLAVAEGLLTTVVESWIVEHADPDGREKTHTAHLMSAGYTDPVKASLDVTLINTRLDAADNEGTRKLRTDIEGRIADQVAAARKELFNPTYDQPLPVNYKQDYNKALALSLPQGDPMSAWKRAELSGMSKRALADADKRAFIAHDRQFEFTDFDGDAEQLPPAKYTYKYQGKTIKGAPSQIISEGASAGSIPYTVWINGERVINPQAQRFMDYHRDHDGDISIQWETAPIQRPMTDQEKLEAEAKLAEQKAKAKARRAELEAERNEAAQENPPHDATGSASADQDIETLWLSKSHMHRWLTDKFAALHINELINPDTGEIVSVNDLPALKKIDALKGELHGLVVKETEMFTHAQYAAKDVTTTDALTAAEAIVDEALKNLPSAPPTPTAEQLAALPNVDLLRAVIQPPAKSIAGECPRCKSTNTSAFVQEEMRSKLNKTLIRPRIERTSCCDCNLIFDAPAKVSAA